MAKDAKDYYEYLDGTMSQRVIDSACAVKNKLVAEDLQQQMKDDTAERYNLPEKEIEEFLYTEYSNPKSVEYLVNGAILTCTNCTKEDKKIRKIYSSGAEIDYIYKAKEDTSINVREDAHKYSDKVLGKLIVTENPKSEITGLKQATVADSKKEDNIPYFGNCKRMPDRDEEMLVFDKMNNESEEAVKKREEGTCKYLMKLEKEWENYEIIQKFCSFTDNEKGEKSGITMTSMLFCKHGGFIYPVASGQVISEQANVGESSELAIEILGKYLSEGDFEEEKVEWALNYLAEQSGHTLVSYDSRNKGYDYNKYDNYILGWIGYYAETTGVIMDPKYIKSQIYEESGMGYTLSQKNIPVANSDTDVMQVLDIRNGNIYDYIGISLNNFSAITSTGDYQTGSWFWKVNHTENNASEPLADSYNKEKKYRCGGIIESLFNTEKDGSGQSYTEGSKENYYFLDENVTPIMSIGLGLDKMQDLLKNTGMNYEKAFKLYNTVKPDYPQNIMQRAESSDNPIIIND